MIKINKLIIVGVIMVQSSGLFASNDQLPQFSKIKIDTLEAQVDSGINNYKKVFNSIAEDQTNIYTWQNIIHPLEDARNNLDKTVNIINHLHSVQDSKQLREVYSNILPKLTDLSAEFYQNKNLYKKILALKGSDHFSKLEFAQQKIINDLLLDFKLAGVDLSVAQQQKYKQITKQLSELSDQFSKNVLDATQAWSYHVSDDNQDKLDGLPNHIISAAKQTAKSRGFKNGWVLTLDLPCVDAVLRYAKDPELRKIIYIAHVTKASEQGSAELQKFDNSKIMSSIVNFRRELAELIGFSSYSEYSLVHKMAKSTTEVLQFLDDLTIKSVPIAKKEFLQLKKFSAVLADLQPWDVAFYAEQYKNSLFNLSEEKLRQYFQLKNILNGMFKLVNNLYGITVEEVDNFDKWDPAIKLYKVIDRDNNLRGFFYTDLYIRDNKRSGAWMAECKSRHKAVNGELQYPVAFLVTNFSPEPLLYHNDVVTLLHEFGHVLHHILTKVDYVSVSGCNGVAWDAVELPSQFMEKWGYNWQFLQDVSSHYQTNAKISKEMFDSIVGIKNYNAGMFMVRQLEFALFDFKLHMYKAQNNLVSVEAIKEIIDQVRREVRVTPVYQFDRFQNSFSHIFAGGYAAGYYSYNWADVLASDAFGVFTDPNVDNNKLQQLGDLFLKNILEMGGSKEAMDLYVAFRGKKPELEALLKEKGL